MLLLSIDGNGQDVYVSTNTTTSNQMWVKIEREATTGIIKFFTSTDSINTDINNINWVQLGSDVAGFTGALFNGNAALRIGGYGDTFDHYNGEIYYVALYNSLTSQTPTQLFNPNEYDRSVNQDSWVSSTGETWTINRDTNLTGLKATIVDKTLIQGNGTSMGMQAASLNINEGAFTNFIVFRKFSNSNSTVGVLTELSNNYNFNQGFVAAVNDLNNSSFTFGTRANVGQNVGSYNNSNLNVQIIMGDWDFSRPHPETLLYSNNVPATTIQQFVTADNTGNMNGTSYNLLARNNAGSVSANVLFFGDIVISGILTTAERTAIYNLLKTKFNL